MREEDVEMDFIEESEDFSLDEAERVLCQGNIEELQAFLPQLTNCGYDEVEEVLSLLLDALKSRVGQEEIFRLLASGLRDFLDNINNLSVGALKQAKLAIEKIEKLKIESELAHMLDSICSLLDQLIAEQQG